MITLVSILFLGFFLGMRHATDADHVIAVTTIVSRQRSTRAAALIGAFWGVGHGLTLLIVGGSIVLFGIVIPQRLGMSFELCVALMLIVLGALNLRGINRGIRDAVHDHESSPHGHAEDAVGSSRLDRWFGRFGFYRMLRPLIIGVVHGLAGSAAVALLVLPMIHDPLWSMAYLLIFGAGTIAGMMFITAAIAVPISYSAGRFQAFHSRIGVAAGVLSLGFGLFLVYQIGFVDGLFTR
ncbi:MAG: high-affinity nickel-transport family protein [Verrucomicrobiota bacterium]|nr:high-affinity nickel-transport family protein [Verrucomicrobiota bacterium]